MDLLHDGIDSDFFPEVNAPTSVSREGLFDILEKLRQATPTVVFNYHLDQMTQFMNNVLRKKQLRLLQDSKINATLTGNSSLAQGYERVIDRMMFDSWSSNASLMSCSRRPSLLSSGVGDRHHWENTRMASTLHQIPEDVQSSHSGYNTLGVGDRHHWENTRMASTLHQIPKDVQSSHSGYNTLEVSRSQQPVKRKSQGRSAEVSRSQQPDKRDILGKFAKDNRSTQPTKSNSLRKSAEDNRSTQPTKRNSLGKSAEDNKSTQPTKRNSRGRSAEVSRNQQPVKRNSRGRSAEVSRNQQPVKRNSRGRSAEERVKRNSGGRRRGEKWGCSGEGREDKPSAGRSKESGSQPSHSAGQPLRSLFLDKLQNKYLPLVSDSPDPFASASPTDVPLGESDDSYLETPKSSRPSTLSRSLAPFKRPHTRPE